MPLILGSLLLEISVNEMASCQWTVGLSVNKQFSYHVMMYQLLSCDHPVLVFF